MILIGYKKDSMSKINYIDDKDLYGRLELLTGNKLFLRLRNAVDHFDADFSDAFSIGQLKSKRWLVKELENSSEKINNHDNVISLIEFENSKKEI